MATVGCHTCARAGERTVHAAPFLWLARRLSQRHERRAHGYVTYRSPRRSR